MRILAIETSCDDTGIAILEYGPDSQPKILADFVSSQIKVHAPWGGVVPTLAKREHQKNLTPLLIKALKNSGPLFSENRLLHSAPRLLPALQPADKIQALLSREPELAKKLIPFLKKYPRPDIDYIAVTQGPGLEPALWVGINFARTLSYCWNIPLLPINHIEGHIIANFVPHWRDEIGDSKKLFPAIALVVSGGHTQLILIKKFGRYKIIGETRDDAAGEAFDKVAKMLNLGYPGGPAISQLVQKQQSPTKYSSAKKTNRFPLPRPMMNSRDFDFSFSGLKTAVLYLLQKMTPAQIKKSTPAIAAEFQQAVIDVLTFKTISAAKQYNAKTVIIAGGVAANSLLRDRLSLDARRSSLNFLSPPINLCMDNATMIALAAYWRLAQNRAPKANWRNLKARANLRIS